MIKTEFNSQTVFLLNDPPAWTDNPTAQIGLIRDTQSSLTQHETARPFSATLVISDFEYTALVEGIELRRLQGALFELDQPDAQPVIMPFWPATVAWADRATAPITGGLMMVWRDDWSQWAVYATGDDEPDWPVATDNWAPALMGFLDVAKPEMLNPLAATWKVKFTESSPAIYAWQPRGGDFAAGPQPAGYAAAPKLFPLAPDFSKVSEEISVEVNREQIGFTRDQSQTVYPQSPRRAQTVDYLLCDGDIGKLLDFLRTLAFPGASYWTASWLQLAELTAAVSATDTILHVRDTAGIVDGFYLAFFAGTQGGCAKVLSHTDDTITLAAPLGADFPVTSLITQLCLARLDKPTAQLTWLNPATAQCELQWTEVVPEYVPAAGETVGDNLGQLKQRVVLFQFDRDYGNGTTDTQYFTNYERDIEQINPPGSFSLSAESVSLCENDLVWTASSGAATYSVFYRDTPSGARNLLASGLTVTHYEDTGLSPGTLRYYEVDALDDEGTTTSNQASATTNDAPVLTVTPSDTVEDGFDFSWTAATGATGYNLYSSTVSGGTKTPVATGITGTTYSGAGFTLGQDYYFTVEAVTSACSGWSAEVPGLLAPFYSLAITIDHFNGALPDATVEWSGKNPRVGVDNLLSVNLHLAGDDPLGVGGPLIDISDHWNVGELFTISADAAKTPNFSTIGLTGMAVTPEKLASTQGSGEPTIPDDMPLTANDTADWDDSALLAALNSGAATSIQVGVERSPTTNNYVPVWGDYTIIIALTT